MASRLVDLCDHGTGLPGRIILIEEGLYTMNTAPCPDCQKMISVTATACPKCGRVFKEGERAAHQKAFEAKVAADSKRSLIIAGVVAIVLLILFLIGNSARVTDEDRMRQMQRMEQTGRDQYR